MSSKKVVDELEEIICADGAGLCPAIEADCARLLTVLENREDDLRQMQKTSPRSMFQQQPEQYRQGLNVLPKISLSAKRQV